MSLTYGFFNSVNGDRKYNAEQISEIFNGIINDGVFANIGTAFAVTATGGGNTISIGVGRAWFDGIWINNDEELSLTVPDSDTLQNRYDAVVIEVNRSARTASIKIISGTPATAPLYPALTNTAMIKQHALAFIHRPAASQYTRQEHVINCIGTSYCPYVTGILQVQNIDKNVAQWEAEFDTWSSEFQNGAIDWLNSVKDTLSEDAEVAIANKIIELEAQMATLMSDCEDVLRNAIPKTGANDDGETKPCASGFLWVEDIQDGETDSFVGFRKSRRYNANSLPPYYANLAAGRDEVRGFSAALVVQDTAEKNKGRFDVWDSGVMTFRPDDFSDYYNVPYGTILAEGMYTGTGVCGSGTPNCINFGYTKAYARVNPKVIFIFSPTTMGYIVLNGIGLLSEVGYKAAYAKYDVRNEWEGAMQVYAGFTSGENKVPTSLYWYNAHAHEYQMNVANRIYKYVIIG